MTRYRYKMMRLRAGLKARCTPWWARWASSRLPGQVRAEGAAQLASEIVERLARSDGRARVALEVTLNARGIGCQAPVPA